MAGEKLCNSCKEPINAKASKCKHCGAFNFSSIGKKVILLTFIPIIFMAGCTALICSIPQSPQEKAKAAREAAEEAKAAANLMHEGDDGYIQGNSLAGASITALDAGRKSQEVKDQVGMTELVIKGQCVNLFDNTKIKLIDEQNGQTGKHSKVRVLSGDHAPEAWWVFPEDISKSKHEKQLNN